MSVDKDSFGVLMFVGAGVTQLAVPDSRSKDGQSMSLEELAKGYQLTKELSPQWWNQWHSADGDSDDPGHTVGN